MQQTYSHSILARVEQNEKYVDMFFNRVLTESIDTFLKTQKYPANKIHFTFPDIGPKKYRILVLDNISYTIESYAIAVDQNFLHGMPVMACSFVGAYKHTFHDENLKIMRTMDIFWITLETPLKRARQIYRIKIVNGVFTLTLDPDLSLGLVLPAHVARFNYIIQPDNLTNN